MDGGPVVVGLTLMTSPSVPINSPGVSVSMMVLVHTVSSLPVISFLATDYFLPYSWVGRPLLLANETYFNCVCCRKLLKYLDEKDLAATFFVVGSRCIERPQLLVEEYMAGHEISVHTWSHHVRGINYTTYEGHD